MIEAMACGTPVIAFRGGSVAEIIEDGVTGFIVESIDEAVEAVGTHPTSIDRRACRAIFEERFSAAAHVRTTTYASTNASSGSDETAAFRGRPRTHTAA